MSSRTVCTICAKPITRMDRKGHCPHCNSPARTRSLPIVLERFVRLRLPKSLATEKPLLAFAMTAAEKKALGATFAKFTSVSLYGNYGVDHIEGVDARDLSRFPSDFFSGVFSILLFDYFVEVDKALEECFRVIAPGGLFFTYVGGYRLVDGDLPATVQSVIRRTETYFNYVPEESGMVSIKVGRETFVRAMERVGFEARHTSIWDEASGERSDWFIGIKSGVNRAAGRVVVGQLPNSKTLGSPLKRALNPNHGRAEPPSMMTMKLTVPQLPNGASGTYFGEHVYSRTMKSSTPHVILTGRSKIVESKDNGHSWEVVNIPDVEKRLLYNCFTTDDGNHIVQCLPSTSEVDTSKRTNPLRATVFLFDKDWKVIEASDDPEARWHGRASIDQCGNTIMFAEYHDNQAKYLPAYRDDVAKWRPLMNANRVFRSRDGGRSWHVVFEGAPEIIRHFHTLQADPFFPGTWWLSSGDRAEESRVWRSTDDGDSWIDVTNPAPSIKLPLMYRKRHQAAFRYTDIVIGSDHMIWGSDDLLGGTLESDPRVELQKRAGSRIYRSTKADQLELEELGYVGHPVRSIVDIGQAYLFITEANRGRFPLNPQVVALFKDEMDKPIEVARIDNFRPNPTGFTYSKASKASLDGRFFSYRNPTDAFNGDRPCVLQWDIELI